ncbi:LysR substrate-binding domain-containing protein [Sporomusa sp.]|uniref:LysR substrate-binding domain-containing protein n=1 Tax=Sporomusa sp. TaxID=2078658 RepID=UPI002BE83A73|nr:LysR substrate-binding domain-containing protein [Sporomusa sp.]HWR08843.1 LysR substrate-binding domain-containing protein [Sporomusa sp.]
MIAASNTSISGFIALVLTDIINSREIIVQTLHAKKMTVVASPFHFLAQQKKISPPDFSSHCLILTLPGCGYRPLILTMLKEYTVKPGALMELSSILVPSNNVLSVA